MAARRRGHAGASTSCLDAIDETGVLEDPGSRIGYILHESARPRIMAKLGLRLDHVLADPTDDGWDSVAEAARARP
jgi:hypothetical protein